MEAILVVKELALANALREYTDHEHAPRILVLLRRHSAQLKPFNSIVTGVNPYVLYFRVIVDNDKRAVLLSELRKLPGVDWANVSA
jgi:hypothetical protein